MVRQKLQIILEEMDSLDPLLSCFKWEHSIDTIFNALDNDLWRMNGIIWYHQSWYSSGLHGLGVWGSGLLLWGQFQVRRGQTCDPVLVCFLKSLIFLSLVFNNYMKSCMRSLIDLGLVSSVEHPVKHPGILTVQAVLLRSCSNVWKLCASG